MTTLSAPALYAAASLAGLLAVWILATTVTGAIPANVLPSPPELLARVRSLLRRRGWEQGGARTRPSNVLVFGKARVDFDTHDVFVDGVPAKLTQLEIDLLRYFATNAGRVLSRDGPK